MTRWRIAALAALGLVLLPPAARPEAPEGAQAPVPGTGAAQPAQNVQPTQPAQTTSIAQPTRTAPTAACAQAGTFRTVIDVGHTVEAPGALSARGVYEYEFNLRLANKIEKDLQAAGFARTALMITAEAPRQGLFRRASRANAMRADLFLSIHHDAVPDSFLETWLVNGEWRQYSDRFPGHSLFVSSHNGDLRGSLAFAHRLGMALKARGLQYTPHYTDKIMGHYQHELIDREAGVYLYDQLVVLMSTRMPAVLLEAGSIVDRDEEVQLASPQRQALTSAAVVEAVDEFCAAKNKQTAPPAVAKRH